MKILTGKVKERIKMKEALILFSGGKDSFLSALKTLEKGYTINLITFQNGMELNTKNIIRIRIPEGFESDGCTLKLKILWLLFGCPHNGKYIPASIIHDYILDNPELVCYNVSISSQIFKQALLNEKVNIFTSNLMYLAVLIYQTLKKIFTKLKENIKCLIQNNF